MGHTKNNLKETIMKRTLNLLVLTSLFTFGASAYAQTVIQQWDFTEDGSGLSNRVSNQGLNATHFDDPDPVAFDGGLTVQTASGFSGDRAIGITLDDTNTSVATMSITLNSFNFSTGTADDNFRVRFRFDDGATDLNQTVGDLNFQKQDANSRIRLTGEAVAGVAVNAETGGPITYGMTLDFQADTYTYWIGTPTSDGSTWSSRFAAHTGSIAGLGTGNLRVDSLQWNTALTSGNEYVLDQIQLSYTAVPEPSTVALLGMAFAGLWVMRRKK